MSSREEYYAEKNSNIVWRLEEELQRLKELPDPIYFDEITPKIIKTLEEIVKGKKITA